MSIESLFGRAYCISLDRRPDRWERFRSGLPTDWPFVPVERVSAVDGARASPPDWWLPGEGAWGCFRSHLKLIERALVDGIESILILEDDALFPADFAQRARRFVAELPSDWGMLYLGGEHLRADRFPPRVLSEQVLVPDYVTRTHAYALRGETLRAIYRHVTEANWHPGDHVDHRLARFVHRGDARYPVYCPRQWLVGQAEGESDIAYCSLPVRFWNGAPEDEIRRPFVAIVGPDGRGCSLLAGVASRLGVAFGSDDEQPHGEGFQRARLREDAELTEICDALVPFPGAERFADAPDVARLFEWIARRRAEADRQGAIAGCASPQLCRLGDALQAACGDRLRLVVLEQDPAGCLVSLRAEYPKADPTSLERRQNWLQQGVRELQAALPREAQLVIENGELLARPASQALRIAEFLELEERDLPCRVARAVEPFRLFAARTARLGDVDPTKVRDRSLHRSTSVET